MPYLYKHKNALVVLTLLFILITSGFTKAQETETQTYKVVKELNGAELRYYPPVMKIQSNNDFGSLFNFISGNNSTREKISMTSPVYLGDVKEIMSWNLYYQRILIKTIPLKP